jgi:hypothetical protein
VEAVAACRVCSVTSDPARLSFLAHRCALDGVSVRRNILHLEGDDIATAKLAVDCPIEHRQVALAVCDLEFCADRTRPRTNPTATTLR